MVAALSDLPHHKSFGFLSWEYHFKEVIGAFFESNRSNDIGRREGED